MKWASHEPHRYPLHSFRDTLDRGIYGKHQHSSLHLSTSWHWSRDSFLSQTLHHDQVELSILFLISTQQASWPLMTPTRISLNFHHSSTVHVVVQQSGITDASSNGTCPQRRFISLGRWGGRKNTWIEITVQKDFPLRNLSSKLLTKQQKTSSKFFPLSNQQTQKENIIVASASVITILEPRYQDSLSISAYGRTVSFSSSNQKKTHLLQPILERLLKKYSSRESLP